MFALVLVGESRNQEKILRFTGAQRSFEFERLAHDQHQADLDDLHDRYYPEPEYPDYQTALGALGNQPVLGEASSIEDGYEAIEEG
ncbi:MAG: hypothetical protein RLZZ435_2669 [Cyanobacteriota bacterium]